MTKIALIDRISNNLIFATYNLNGKETHSKAFFKVNEDLTFKVKNSRKLTVKSGDSVEVFIEPRNAIAVSFFMFIFPLILFMTMYSLMGTLVQSSSESAKIITGIFGIVASFIITYIFFKLKPQELPEITRVLKEKEVLEKSCSACGSCKSCG